MAELVRELRSASLVDADVQGRTVRGYAAVYDSPWNERLVEEMGYIETIARGAFRKALTRSTNVPLLREHRRHDMLATTRNESLRLKDEATGLYFEADLPKTQLGNDTLEQVKRGDVWGMSYGMVTRSEDSTVDRYASPPTRRIDNIQRLTDVTMTYEPAYEAATVELRSTGFVALPLQELDDGVEAQIVEGGSGIPSLEAMEYQRRVREVRIGIIERGGVL